MVQSEELKTQELIKKLSDKTWRMNNIYKIADENGDTIQFIPNAIQKSIMEQTSNYRDIILKYRQGGVSTYKIIDLLDDTLFGGINRNNVFITHKQDLLDEFFKKARFSYENLDPTIKALLPLPKTDNANELYFPKTKTGKPLNNTLKISLDVRGKTPTNLHISEFAWMDLDRQRKTKKAIDEFRKTKITIETTANGIGDIFYHMCMNAKNGKGTYKLLFFPWYIEKRNQEPTPSNFEYTPDEINLLKTYPFLTKEQVYWRRLKIEDANALGLNGIDMFHEENPITIDSAFVSSGTSVFNLTSAFKIVKPLEEYEGWKIFVPEPQDNLVFAVDIAEGGNNGDFSTIVGYNRQGQLICTYKGRVAEEVLASKLDLLFKYEKNGRQFLGWIIPENNIGRLFIKICQGYPWAYRLHHEIKPDVPINETKEPNKFGFRTTMSSKDYIIRLFKGAIHKEEVEISEEIYSEIVTYQYDQNNRPNAISPNHDDLLMATMIAYFGVSKIYGALEYEEKEKKLGDNRAEDLVIKSNDCIIPQNYLQSKENFYNEGYEYEEFII